MCESNVFVAEDGREELLMEDVGWVETDGDELLLKDIEGNARTVHARLQYADLVQHRLVLEPTLHGPREDLLRRAVAFHGHLGPFLVLGLRMGLLARKRLGFEGHFDVQVRAHVGDRTPITCLADGLQFSTGATLGKGNIELLPLRNDHPAAVITSAGKSLDIRLSDQARELVRGLASDENLAVAARRLESLDDEELFEVEEA